MRHVPGDAPPIHPLMHVPVPWVYVLGYLVGMLPELWFHTQVPPAALGAIHGAGWVLLGLGGVLAVWSLSIFRRLRTTTVPFNVSTHLVTWGPYRLSRNPMYVSLTTIYLGETGILARAWPLLTLLLVIAYMNVVVIPYEESRLRETFGAAYDEYCQRVRRWIGRR